VASIRPNAQVEFDLLGFIRDHIVDVHHPTVEIDRLRFVLEQDSDVRNEERLFHKLLIQQRAAYSIDRLFGTAK